jgi:hypothetical protein
VQMGAGVLMSMPSRSKVTSMDTTIDDRSLARRKFGGFERTHPRWRPQEGHDVVDATTIGSR